MNTKNLTTQDLFNPELFEEHYPKILAQTNKYPENPDGYVLLALMELGRGNYTKSLEYVNTAIGLAPTFGGHKLTLSAIYGAMGNFDISQQILEQLRATDPSIPSVNWNLALSYLSEGNFHQGWELYQWRKVGITSVTRRWPTHELTGLGEIHQTLFIWDEQGLGDAVMNLRLLKRVKEQLGFGTVIYECPAPLYTLARKNITMSEVDFIFQKQNDLSVPGHFDEHCSIMDLPRLLNVLSYEDYQSDGPYIKSDENIVELWKESFKEQGFKKKKIGVCWTGSESHVNDRNRSMSAENLLAFKDFGHLVGLQLQDLKGDIEGLEILDVRETLLNLDYLAALLSNLDCVITVDTMVAHLAGAMGIETYLLLPFVAEWRWGSRMAPKMGSIAPLYPSIKMFRQQAPEDWSAPIEEIKKCLIQRGL